MSSTTQPFPAVVAYPPNPHPVWLHEQLSFSRPVGPRELRVRMLTSGICHTDVFASSVPHGTIGITYPKVMGHEGAGYVEEVGTEVTIAKPGDPVLLSHAYCQTCQTCAKGDMPHCRKFGELNNVGEEVFTSDKEGQESQKVSGKFFGQSSFASMSIVGESSVVNVKGVIKNDEELKLLAPLGCGMMTGMGTVYYDSHIGPDDNVLVTGIGAVGLAAIMAAKIQGAKTIIALDRVAARLELAKEVGATHVFNTTGKDLTKVGEEIKQVSGLQGDERITLAIETTGVAAVAMAAYHALGSYSKLILVGILPLGTEVMFPIADLFFMSKTVTNTRMGGGDSRVAIPLMIEWWRQGNFPVEKLVKFFPAKDVQDALDGMESGKVIKPVLVW